MMLSFKDALLLGDEEFDKAAKNKASLRLNAGGSKGYRVGVDQKQRGAGHEGLAEQRRQGIAFIQNFLE